MIQNLLSTFSQNNFRDLANDIDNLLEVMIERVNKSDSTTIGLKKGQSL